MYEDIQKVNDEGTIIIYRRYNILYEIYVINE